MGALGELWACAQALYGSASPGLPGELGRGTAHTQAHGLGCSSSRQKPLTPGSSLTRCISLELPGKMQSRRELSILPLQYSP